MGILYNQQIIHFQISVNIKKMISWSNKLIQPIKIILQYSVFDDDCNFVDCLQLFKKQNIKIKKQERMNEYGYRYTDLIIFCWLVDVFCVQ